MNQRSFFAAANFFGILQKQRDLLQRDLQQLLSHFPVINELNKQRQMRVEERFAFGQQNAREILCETEQN